MDQKFLLASLAALLLVATPLAAQTQTGSVGIGTTAPDASAALDIVSSAKGVLLPRVAAATAIASPAPGLLVYQTGAPAGFYYNAGTATASSWQQLATAGSGTGTNPGDNLGNHIATQPLNLNGNKLVGGTTDRAVRGGLGLDGNGLLTLGAARVSADSTTTFGVRLTDMDQDFVLTSKQGKGKINPLNVSGAGDRVMWQSYYGAFRAGGVSGNRWDYNHMGKYSAAFGYDNEVLGEYSAAFGYNNWVRFGQYTFITGIDNVGLLCDAGFMTGRENKMRSSNGFVGGYQSKVQSSTSSTGFNVPSFAFGYRCQARSSTSNSGSAYALGYYARTGGYRGCFVLADMSPYQGAYPDDSLVSTAHNQFSARFAGGYRFYSTTATPGSNAAVGTPVGVKLDPGQNAWSVISDSTKKERRVLADGNVFLARIGAMRLGSWNYRGQSPDTMRHYGPMAQDFYAAFGHDGIGRSGNDTTINQADFDGVSLIAIQALYRRVQALEADNARLRHQLSQQRAAAPAATPSVTATLEAFEARLRRLEAGGAQTQR